MVQGSRCKLYAGVEDREAGYVRDSDEKFAAIENEFHNSGYDGVFVFNYDVNPYDRQEYRTANVAYRVDSMISSRTAPPLFASSCRINEGARSIGRTGSRGER
jgi:hypothetical protein